jgi:hypothetical protein
MPSSYRIETVVVERIEPPLKPSTADPRMQWTLADMRQFVPEYEGKNQTFVLKASKY